MFENWSLVIEEILDHIKPEEVPTEFLDQPFADALWPWIAIARNRLHLRLNKSSLTEVKIPAHISSQAMFSLEQALLKRWSELCSPSMLLEMKLRSLETSLQGNSPRERYLDFLKHTYLQREKLAAFFHEYPELARLVATYLIFWVEQATELITRLHTDCDLLSQAFNANQPLGEVKTLQMDAGDPHHNGRSVAILQFESGIRIVYKPKNAYISQSFNVFIDRLNDLGLTPCLKSYVILPRNDANGDYGWEEAVPHLPCSHLDHVHMYYERAGMLLGLMYLLAGTDMHYENIIASGEFPILIDLETLFHSQLRKPHQESVENTMQHSVLVTGLLPAFALRKSWEKGLDLSGLGQGATPTQIQWLNINTDQMERSDEVSLSQYSSNQVLYNNVVVSVCDYVEDIVTGFRKLYSFIQNNHSLLEREQWIARMATNAIRIVVRPTRFYAYIIQQLHSPYTLLKDELRERTLLLLNRTFGNAQQIPETIQAEERRALLQGDIPCFNTIPNSTDLFSLDKLISKNCLDNNTYQSACVRLQTLNAADRMKQELFIRQSFEIKNAEVHATSGQSTFAKAIHSLPKNVPANNEILAQAKTLALHLRNQAIVDEDHSLGWIHLEPNLESEQYSLQPLGESLYSGRMGIALFFAALGKISHDTYWIQEALHCLIPLRKSIKMGKIKQLINTYGIGGMAGIGGIIYGLFQIGKIGERPELIEAAQNLLHAITEQHIREDVQYDLVSGSVGLILSLFAYYDFCQDPQALYLAKVCGDHLCDKASHLGAGALGWSSHGNVPLLGLSHGAAGVAYALFKLGSIEKNEKFLQVAQGALLYERNQFCAEKKNWPRLGIQGGPAVCTWCHGASGVGLARLASRPYLTDSIIDQEIDTAIDTTKHCLYDGPLTLCCGPLGRLELLQEASCLSLRPELTALAQDMLNAVFHYVNQENASNTFRASPSFMQGTAGLGYTLLRRIDTEKCLPQVLLLGA